MFSSIGDYLLEDVGRKLKAVARFLVYLAIVVGVILILIGFVKFIKDVDCFEFATVLGGAYYSSLERSGNSSFAGLMMMIFGIAGTIASFLSSMLMYGFGELVEKATASSSRSIGGKYSEKAASIVTPQNDSIEDLIDSTRQPPAGEWKCSCGKIHPKYVSSCTCGKSRNDI